MPEIRCSESVPEDVGKDPTGSDIFWALPADESDFAGFGRISVISTHDNTVLSLIDAARDSNQNFIAIYLNSSYRENDEDH
ncbi:unnamed protein product, partial [Didymodactylos carnosus]